MYIRKRYNHHFINILNNNIRLRDKLRSLREKIKFLLSYSLNHVIFGYISKRIFKIKCRNYLRIDQTFLRDEILPYSDLLNSAKFQYQSLCSNEWSSLSMLSKGDIFIENRNTYKNQSYLNSLI